MKRISYLISLCAVLGLTMGCTGNGTSESGSGADSVYAWENIRKYYIKEPELALRMIDTAEEKGVEMLGGEAELHIKGISIDWDKISRSRDSSCRALKAQTAAASSKTASVRFWTHTRIRYTPMVQRQNWESIAVRLKSWRSLSILSP